MKNSFIGILFTLVMVSCGAPSGKFRLEGSFRNLNQGEFYLYSLDGRGKIDTIQLHDGQFRYEASIDEPHAYSLIFPNFSEIPIFAESGASVDINGDASHLKVVNVGGTTENDLMTDFRLDVAEKTPPQVLKAAEEFIKKNPATMGSIYILNKHFIQKSSPDYKKALTLCRLIEKAQPDNRNVSLLRKQLTGMKTVEVGKQLPKFDAVDVKGKRANNASLSGEVNVVMVWATWNYESDNLMRQLRVLKKDYGSRLGIVTINVDASQRECRKAMDRDSVNWSVICDGRMLDTPVLTQLGINDVPFNALTDSKGKILAINISQTELKLQIKKTLK